MNVWIQSKYQPWEEGLIKHFQNKGAWEKVIWTSDKNPDQSYTDYTNMAFIPNHSYKPVPAHVNNNLYPHLYQFCDMYARTSVTGSHRMYDGKNIHDYMNIFNILISYYYNALKENNIGLVILFAAPHVGRDLMLYLVARELGAKTLILEQSLFPDKFFFYWDQYDFGKFTTSKTVADFVPVKIENKFEKDLIYMQEYLKSLKKKDKFSFSEWINKIRNSEEVKLLKELRKPDKRAFAYLKYVNQKRFKKNALAIVRRDFDLDLPFVYFPLHLQPEKTTSSWGGKYCDQVLAIEQLSQRLPKGWWIYVKENPKQTTHFMRGPWFYARLRALHNVKVVPPETNTYDLLKKSQFVATITGTVGWEAITGGKNALVFGWGMWYKTFPGCFHFTEDFTVDEILSYKIDHAELEEKVALLQTKMGKGVIYKGLYKDMVSNYSEEENFKNIISSLEKILEI